MTRKRSDKDMKTAYINGIILDGSENMVPAEGKVIIVEDEKIASIADASSADLSGCEVVDLGGQYILPGLINLHVHLAGSGKPSKKQLNLPLLTKIMTGCALGRAIGAGMVAGNARNTLMAGITTVRAVGGIGTFDTRVRDDINKGKRIGPRILTSDCAISVPGGHMAGSFAYVAESADDAAALVDRIAKGKPDLIKLMITGGVLDADEEGPGALRMSAEYVKAACDRAHELGYPVAAHCESTHGIRVALENGVNTIEHGAEPDEDIIRLFKEKNACQVLTISPALPYSLALPGVMNLTETSVENSNIVMQGMIDLAKANLKEGVPVGLGMDSACSYATHYDLWREMRHFVNYCGVSNSFALHTATLINARIAGIDGITGSIEEGKYADMIVVEKNPLEDLSALRDVSMVVFEGKRYDRPEVKKYEEVETVLDGVC